MLSVLRRWWPAWLLLFLVFTVTTLPARLIGWVLPASVSLEGVSGTLWSGRASRAAVGIRGNIVMLGEATWRLQPFSLLLARPTVDVTTRWGDQTFDGEVAVNWRGEWRVRDAVAVSHIGWVRNLLPLYVDGRVRAEFAELAGLDSQLQTARGRVVWEQAAWAARAGSLPLGTYALDIGGEAGAIAGRVITLAGGLQVEGGFSLDDRDYGVDLTLAGPALRNEGLRQAMVLFAVPDGDIYRVDLNGRL